jgi:hypothetical protein
MKVSLLIRLEQYMMLTWIGRLQPYLAYQIKPKCFDKFCQKFTNYHNKLECLKISHFNMLIFDYPRSYITCYENDKGALNFYFSVRLSVIKPLVPEICEFS